MAMLHAMAPLVVMSGGLALVVLAGKLDISIGSVAFLSSTVAVLLMNRHGVACRRVWRGTGLRSAFSEH